MWGIGNSDSEHYELTPLDVAIVEGDFTVVKYLLHRGADFAHGSLHFAVTRWRDLGSVTAIIDILISMGAEVNDLDDYNHTPLWLAMIYGDYPYEEDVIRVLLEHGAMLSEAVNNRLCNGSKIKNSEFVKVLKWASMFSDEEGMDCDAVRD